MVRARFCDQRSQLEARMGFLLDVLGRLESRLSYEFTFKIHRKGPALVKVSPLVGNQHVRRTLLLRNKPMRHNLHPDWHVYTDSYHSKVLI